MFVNLFDLLAIFFDYFAKYSAAQAGFNPFDPSPFGSESSEQAYPGYSDQQGLHSRNPINNMQNLNFEADPVISGFSAMGMANTFQIPPSHERLPSSGPSSFFQGRSLEPSDPYSFPESQPRQDLAVPLQPLQYHLYAPPLPYVSNMAPHQKGVHFFFMDDKLRETLQRQSEATYQILDPNCLCHFHSARVNRIYFPSLCAAPEAQMLPSEIHGYHSLFPLDPKPEKLSKVFGFSTSVYKAVSSIDGKPYVLRRIE
ncbi:PAB-dependent poly(A)-specific ribonuclease subunit 3, partial [Physocladia obscura]